MANFYVSVNRGSDATGDGSATNPWRTIGKAIGPSPAVVLDPANPNAVYIEPGVYREGISLGISPTSSGPLAIVGDADGAGFAAGGHSNPSTGLVDWRGWSSDSTPLAANCLAAGSKSYVTLRRIKFTCGNVGDGAVTIDNGTDWTVQDCILLSSYAGNMGNVLTVTPAAGVPLNLTIERCDFHSFYGGNGAIVLTIPFNSTDWSLDSKIVNCAFRGRNAGVFLWQQYGSGTKLAGGLAIQNCTFQSPTYGVYAYYSNSGVTLNTPIAVHGSVFLGCSLRADGTGHMIEDGNIFMSAEANTNVAAGANSIFNACPALDFGDNRLTGLPLAPLGTPLAGSLFAGFGSYGTTPSTDLAGRNRPEGTGSTAAAAGCLERHDTGVKDVTHQDAGSSACMALIGPSSQDRPILVDATSTTLSVKVRWDGNHGDLTKPQAVLIAEPQIGVAGQVVTATSTGGTGSTPNAYETLTFAPFTPSSPGVVMLRMVSRAAAGNGTAYFDTITL